jgi:hypothetical protein
MKYYLFLFLAAIFFVLWLAAQFAPQKPQTIAAPATETKQGEATNNVTDAQMSHPGSKKAPLAQKRQPPN